jgi:hypothetical protein
MARFTSREHRIDCVEHSRFRCVFGGSRGLNKTRPDVVTNLVNSNFSFRPAESTKAAEVAAGESFNLAGLAGGEPATSGVTGRGSRCPERETSTACRASPFGSVICGKLEPVVCGFRSAHGACLLRGTFAIWRSPVLRIGQLIAWPDQRKVVCVEHADQVRDLAA